MTRRDTAPLGAPCWIELFSSDLSAAAEFYGSLFGWSVEDAGEEMGHYHSFSQDGLRIAGGMANHGDAGAPDMWTVYLATPDAQKTADLAAAHGGTVIVAPMPVADLGTMAVLLDPSGAGIAAWQPGTHQGFQILDEPGAPSWFELLTPRYDDALAFYRDVFDWDTDTVGDSAEFRYTTLGTGDEAKAGVMDARSWLPEGSPGAWSIYFTTDDIDASIARAQELGATLVNGPEDTPYGQLAEMADPGGVTFKLRTPPSQAQPPA